VRAGSWLLLALVALVPLSRSATAAQLRRSHLNPIQLENRLPGTTAWQIQTPALNGQISGYGSAQSVAPGQRISFFVSTKASRFTASIFRMGWYGGDGGRLMVSTPSLPGVLQPVPAPDPRNGLLVCNWSESFSIEIPSSWVSGIYLVKLTSSTNHQSYIPFVVRGTRHRSPLLMIDAVTTSEAYNVWGGKSLYVDSRYRSAAAAFDHRAVMVSFDRPYQQNDGAGWFLSWEIHMVRWLESRGYDVSYADDLDVNDHPGILLHRKGIIIAGHDEYWSMAMRDAMDGAVASGVGLANFAANTGYWQIRLAPLGSQRDAIEICYKDFKRDPIHSSDPTQATVMWRSKQVHRPESELLGAMYEDYLGRHGPYPWVVKNPHSWIFKGRRVSRGTSVKGIVGHEEDALLGRYPHPPQVRVLSASPVRTSTGSRRKSNSTLYRTARGAMVFNAGTIDWSYGLDDIRASWWSYPPARSSPSPLIERVTANVLARL